MLNGESVGVDRHCVVEECRKPPRSQTSPYCEMHYTRMRRGSDMTAPELKRNPSRRCEVAQCEKKANGRFCSMHHARFYRHGSPHMRLPPARIGGSSSPTWKGDDIGYSGAHMRLRGERGSPSKCDHCGRTGEGAYHWALNWSAEPSVRVDQPSGLRYSVRPSDYVRLCVSCHKHMDLGHRGHAISAVSPPLPGVGCCAHDREFDTPRVAP